MKQAIAGFIAFLTFGFSSVLLASPSEHNQMRFTLKGEDAQSFRDGEVSVNMSDHGKFISKDLRFSFKKEFEGDDKLDFHFAIECQERTPKFEDVKVQGPLCSFTYRTEDANGFSMYTTMEMHGDLAKQMMASFRWNKLREGLEVFGCFDFKESGCPSIRFRDPGDDKLEVNLVFLNP